MSVFCCGGDESGAGGAFVRLEMTARASRGPGLWRRVVAAAGWLLPSATLVLLPKCPVCFAALIAVGTGVGIPVATAAYLRTSLVAVCAFSLLFVVARRARRPIARLFARGDAAP
jgi:hypothetical protein